LESKKWSQLHTIAKEQQASLFTGPSQQAGHGLAQAAEHGLAKSAAEEQAAAAAATENSLPDLGVQIIDGQRRMLAETAAASQSVPIRIWVEYQGLSRLQQDLQNDLRNTVNVALGVLAKYFRVSSILSQGDWHALSTVYRRDCRVACSGYNRKVCI
jgi:hypothetical protein